MPVLAEDPRPVYPPQDLLDEVEAINAIYGENTLQIVNANNTKVNAKLSMPSGDGSFWITFPSNYPLMPPGIGDPDVSLYDNQVSRVQLVRILLFLNIQNVFVPGSVCIFDLIEACAPVLACLKDNGLDLDEARKVIPSFDLSDWRWTRMRNVRSNNLCEISTCVICLEEDFRFKMVGIPCDHHLCIPCLQGE